MRSILDHFSRQLGALHDAFGDAPAALLQHVLDTYVHLYSAHFQHMRQASPSQPPSQPLLMGSAHAGKGTLRGAEADHAASLSGTYSQVTLVTGTYSQLTPVPCACKAPTPSNACNAAAAAAPVALVTLVTLVTRTPMKSCNM